MPDPGATSTRTLPRALAAALLITLILVGLGTAAVRSFLAEEADYDRDQAILSRTRHAHRLVLIELESIRAQSGRYPATLTPAGGPMAYQWLYRPAADGSDYELWCSLPGEHGGTDALVFSPDGAAGTDWPAGAAVPGTAWHVIPHAERAPADRWPSATPTVR